MKFSLFKLATRIQQRVAVWRQGWPSAKPSSSSFAAPCRRVRKAQRRAAFTQHTMAQHSRR